MTSRDDLERLVTTTVDAHGGIDILVNNSGGPPRTTAAELDAEKVEAAVALLLVSVVRLTGLCLPYLERSAAGRIVNVTSSSVREPIDYARALERDPARRRRLGEVARARARAERDHRELPRARAASTRIGSVRCTRTGRARTTWRPSRCAGSARTREIGDVVAFLCSERASYVSGTVMLVDGALTRGL